MTEEELDRVIHDATAEVSLQLEIEETVEKLRELEQRQNEMTIDRLVGDGLSIRDLIDSYELNQNDIVYILNNKAKKEDKLEIAKCAWYNYPHYLPFVRECLPAVDKRKLTLYIKKCGVLNLNYSVN